MPLEKLTNQKQYEKLREAYPQLLIYYTYENGKERCDHCDAIESHLDNMCTNHGLGLDSPVAVVSCNLKNDFCKKLWAESKPPEIDAKKYGIPILQGISKSGNHKKPNFFSPITSEEDIKVISNFINALGQQVEKVTGKKPPIRQQQMQQQVQQRKPQSGFSSSGNNINIRQQVQDLITSKLPSITNIFKLNANESYTPSENDLCIPGVTCDRDTFNKKALSWVFS